ncbi:hypothetical protein EauS123_00013 [Exiguobacterium phage vB_EauS-123]|nr:hypothetical protein EauS123_00013 [Exiguobacterium phage vB_EauS-123]
MSAFRKQDIETATRNAIKEGFRQTKDHSIAINTAIDKVFERFGNLSEQELNIVRTVLARHIDRHTKQFQAVGK